jgi:hypothetical protein
MQDPHKRRSAQHSDPGLAQSPVQERRRNLAVHDGPGALVAACRCSGGRAEASRRRGVGG